MKNSNEYIMVDSKTKEFRTIKIEGFLGDKNDAAVKKILKVENVETFALLNDDIMFCNLRPTSNDKLRGRFTYNGCYSFRNDAILYSYDKKGNRIAPNVTIKELKKKIKFPSLADDILTVIGHEHKAKLKRPDGIVTFTWEYIEKENTHEVSVLLLNTYNVPTLYPEVKLKGVVITEGYPKKIDLLIAKMKKVVDNYNKV